MKLPTAHLPTVFISIFCIIYLIVFKELINPLVKRKSKVELPAELILVITFFNKKKIHKLSELTNIFKVVFLTIISYTAGLNEKYDVIVIGHVPTG